MAAAARRPPRLRPCREDHLIRRISFICLLLFAGAAQAQWSLSASYLSDYRYRGLSLSEGRGVPQLGAAWDCACGAYAGAMLSRASLRYTLVDAQNTVYAGFAARLNEQWSWDAGAARTRYRNGANYDYHEAYAGLSQGRSSVRLAWSPHYFGVGGRTLYGEFNTSMALTENLDVLAHAGYLHGYPREGRYQFQTPARTDWRLGLAYHMDAWSAQLAWNATRHGTYLYPAGRGASTRALNLSLTRGF